MSASSFLLFAHSRNGPAADPKNILCIGVFEELLKTLTLRAAQFIMQSESAGDPDSWSAFMLIGYRQ